MLEDDWFGMYQEGLKGVIHKRAFRHPAKVSLALAKHIYVHAINEGWIVPGRDLCLDPMAGVATFGLVAAGFGIRWIGIELEDHFCQDAQASIALHTREWLTLGKPLPLLLQGDSRYLQDIIGQAKCVVSSPPYSDSAANDSQRTFARTGQLKGINEGDTYKPQLVISSPPYADGCRQTGGLDLHPEHIQGGTNGHVLRDYAQPQMIISSPPWDEGAPSLPKNRVRVSSSSQQHGSARPAYQPMKGNPGQIGGMKEGSLTAIITSPPYVSGGHHPDQTNSWGGLATKKGLGTKEVAGYGHAKGQIGQEPEPTYWSSMKTIYEAAYNILPTNGHLILVLKGFVRRGAYVDLPAQTAQLLEYVGFEIAHKHKAMQVSGVGQLTMDGGEYHKITRKSYFRKVAEDRGAPVIDHEIVLCAVKV